MRACALPLLGFLAESASPFELSRIDLSTAKGLFYQFLEVEKTTVFDTSFDVNCNENHDHFCYDYCLSHCAIPANVSPTACGAKLPAHCNAIYGGLRVISSHMNSAMADVDSDPGVSTWSIDVTEIAEAAQTIMKDHSVDFVETYLGIPPARSQQTWASAGAQESPIDEGSATGSLCNGKKNATAALELWYQVYGPNGQLAPLKNLVQSTGVQPAGRYIAKLGWKLFQGYLGQWENELFKRFAIFPMAREMIINDVLFPTQYSVTPTNLHLRLQKFDDCLDQTILYQDLPYSFFLVWSKRVDGDVVQKPDQDYLPSYDSWGYPIPRDSESCRGAKSCEACRLMVASNNSPCSWCMTAQGQSCATVCDDTFNYPLQCSGTSARVSVGLMATMLFTTLLH